MGLDMYLTAKKYVSPYKHSSEERAIGEQIGKLVGAPEPGEGEDMRVEGVAIRAGYWRKANQVHAWFVREVQSGKDDCGHYYVAREKLLELRDLCDRVIAASELVDGTVNNGYQYTRDEAGEPVKKAITAEGKVIKNPAVAKMLLPSESGFFFGGTDYDQYYLEDVADTIKVIDAALALPDCWDFEYHSSW